jgi:acetylornithine/N-succinyldiaminopimelate aminotransferase
MKLFDVYPLFDIQIETGKGNYIYDNKGQQYLDLYGGHAPISIGHSHPTYVRRISEQVAKLGFYSNSIINPLQIELAQKLGEASQKEEYSLFMCNSGAEANENALKLASFHTGKKKIISFSKGFHGRTSLAVAVTDNKKIIAPVNEYKDHLLLPFNNVEALKEAFTDEVCAVIVEGIQGLAGIYEATPQFLQAIRDLCDQHHAVFILDSVQCGYGRSGKFFASDHFSINADIYTTAKAMGNGFPIGGVIISPKFKAVHSMLGTTFGGSHLACAAALAVLDVYKEEKLVENAANVGAYAIGMLKSIDGVKEVRGKGLMIGIELEANGPEIRKNLLFQDHIFTGSSSQVNTIRLLPALNLSTKEIDIFVEKLIKQIQKTTQSA